MPKLLPQTPASSPVLEPNNRMVCLCCGLLRGVHQIQRHLKILREHQAAELGVDTDGDSNDLDLADNELGLAGDGLAGAIRQVTRWM
jgi:hypothetical protein